MRRVRHSKVVAVFLTVAMVLGMIPTVTFAKDSAGNVPQAQEQERIEAFSGADEQNEMNGTCGAAGQEDSVIWAVVRNNGDDTNPAYTLLINGTGEMADFSVSNDTDDRPWKSYADSITKVEIGEGVASIGNSAFRNLTALKESNIPASVKKLGDNIYRGDVSLTTVKWADGFRASQITDTDSNAQVYTGAYVPTSMFDGCSSLGKGQELSAWLPESFAGVGCAAFRGTAFDVDFEKWTNLSYIGAYGFSSMPNLDSLTVLSGWELGLRGTGGISSAFSGSGVKKVVIESREIIPSGMFQNCASLSSVTLAENTKTIGTNAFMGTTALQSIDLKNVETVSGYAFDHSGITELVLPQNLKTVEVRAFRGNKNLASLVVDSSDIEIKNAFMGCSALAYVETKVDTKVKFNNSFAATTQPDETACTAVAKMVANGTIEGSIAALTGLKELTVNGESSIGITAASIPASVETLTIIGDQWEMGNYSFAKSDKPVNLFVTADKVSSQEKATFRSNLTLETAKFTGSNVALNENMFMGCANLKQLDLSEVETLTISANVFSNDTNTDYTGGAINEFNKDCYIYVADETAAVNVRKNTGLTTDRGIVLAVNGGSVKMGGNGFDSVTKANYHAEWYNNADFTGDPVAGSPEAGKTYYAKWIRSSYTLEGTIDNSKLEFGTVEYGKTQAKTITASLKSGTASVKSVKSSNESVFTAKVNDAVITVTPVSNLPVGSYAETLTVITGDDTVFSVALTLTIEQTDPVYTVPSGLAATVGQTLADVDLPDGFTWMDSMDTSVGEAGFHTFKVTYTPMDTVNYRTVENIEVTLTVNPKSIILNKVPTITAEDITLIKGDTFDVWANVTATDAEDGDLTDEIEIIANSVDTSKAGTYSLTYKVTDSQGASATKTITVTVQEKTSPEDPTDNNTSGSDGAGIWDIISPKTGDEDSLGLRFFLISLSVAGLAGALTYGRKRKYNR